MDYKVILETVVGSTLHGTAVQDGLEDLDLMAIVVESPRHGLLLKRPDFEPHATWISRTKPEGVRSEAGDVDWVGHALRKYVALALKGNPTVLLPLFAEDENIKFMSATGEALRALAPALVSKFAYYPYKHYMQQQTERLLDLRGQKNVTRPELIEKYGYDVKYAAHIVRLGYQGIELLTTGRLTLPMPPMQRASVVAVRTGQLTLPEVTREIDAAQQLLAQAYEKSPLPAEPNYAAAEDFIVRTYLYHWSNWGKA